MKLSNNTILITGGGSGIGLAFTKALLERSNTVVICGRNLEKLQLVKNDLPSVAIFQCDIAKDAEREQLLEFIRENHGSLNVLINNAGIQNSCNFDGLSSHSKLIEDEIAINFTAQVKLIDDLLPLLLKQPKSLILNITSALAIVSKQSSPVYCGTKAALRSFTEALRYQLEDSAVRVVEVMPALVESEMTKGRGRGKMNPDEFVSKALIEVEKGRNEIKVGKARILFLLNRIAPYFARKIVRYG